MLMSLRADHFTGRDMPVRKHPHHTSAAANFPHDPLKPDYCRGFCAQRLSGKAYQLGRGLPRLPLQSIPQTLVIRRRRRSATAASAFS